MTIIFLTICNSCFRVEIDCRGIFQAGQLAVAMSRVRTVEGLRVINYHPRYVIPPPQAVKDFMGVETDRETSSDLKCCNHAR